MTAKRVLPLILSRVFARPSAAGVLIRVLPCVIGLGLATAAVAAPAPGDCEPYKLGQAALGERKLPIATSQFLRAVADSCEVGPSRRNLADLAWRQGRLEQAERYQRDAMAWDKRHGGAATAGDHVMLALLLIRMNRPQDAATELQRADVIDGNGWDTVYGRARLCLTNKEWAGAAAQLGRFPKGPEGVKAMGEFFFATALHHVGTEELAQAEGEALRAVAADPVDPERLALFHRICKERGTTATGIAALEQAKAETGKVAPAPLLTELGRMYQTNRRFNEARDMYVAAVAADSNFAPAILDLGDLMRLAKKPTVAVQLYMRYLAQAPRDVEAMLHISEACLAIGQNEQAAKTAREAMMVAPSRPDVRRNFVRAGLKSTDAEIGKAAVSVFNGMANDPTWTADDWLSLAEYHRQAGNFDGAKDATARAATFDPAAPAIEFERGLIELSAGNTPQAITHLQAAVAAKPDAPSYHLNLGLALMKVDRKVDGMASMRHAIAVNPQYTQGRLVLAQWLANADSVQAGNDQFRAILAYEPTNGAALCGLGWSAVRIADCKEAQRLFKSVVDSDPKNAEGWAGLGSAAVCASDLKAAADSLERARQIDPENVNVKRGLDLLARARSGSAP